MSKSEFEVDISQALKKYLDKVESTDSEEKNDKKVLAVIQNRRKRFPRLMKKYSNGSVIFKILTSNGEVRLSDDVLRLEPLHKDYELSEEAQIEAYEVFIDEIEKRGYDIDVELKLTKKV